jgi:hypothetical protein
MSLPRAAMNGSGTSSAPLPRIVDVPRVRMLALPVLAAAQDNLPARSNLLFVQFPATVQYDARDSPVSSGQS